MSVHFCFTALERYYNKVMEQINSYSEALRYMKEGFTVCTAEAVPVYFNLRDNRVRVHTEQYSLRLSLTEWKELYGEKVFCLCEDADDQLIDPEKDKEYYSWRHK